MPEKQPAGLPARIYSLDNPTLNMICAFTLIFNFTSLPHDRPFTPYLFRTLKHWIIWLSHRSSSKKWRKW